MSDETITRILHSYGLEAASIQAAQKGYRNESYAIKATDGSALNLILYKREQGILQKIRSANRTGDFLADKGFPARKTADTRIIRLSGDDDYVRYGALYEYLPGSTIPWEAYTMKHIKNLGAMMSDMHYGLRPLPQMEMPFITDEYTAIVSHMQAYLAQDGVKAALASKLSLKPPQRLRKYLKLMEVCGELRGQQALHMDFVRGNILFDHKADITGVLDFEKAAWGHPVFDIARSLAFLLVDCKYKDETTIRKYFLWSGYHKRGRSTLTQTNLLEALVDMFLVYDFYKFLRHNPYEYLEQNEHFVRTRGLLLKRNIISKAKVLK